MASSPTPTIRPLSPNPRVAVFRAKRDNYFPLGQCDSVDVPEGFYCSGYEQLRAKRAQSRDLLISHRIGKMGKDFLFYPNSCNFTEFLLLASTGGKSMKTGLRRLQNRIIQPKPVTLAPVVLFSGAALSCMLLCASGIRPDQRSEV